MKLNGENIIQASRVEVWDALNDPAVLKATIENDINSHWENDFDEVKNKVEILNNPPNFDQMDISVILTEWREFKGFTFKNSEIFDGRNLLHKNNIFSIGKN